MQSVMNTDNVFVQNSGPEIAVQHIQELAILGAVVDALVTSLLTVLVVWRTPSVIVMVLVYVMKNGTLLRTVPCMVENVMQHVAHA